jgi:hypothetical protein
MVYTGDLLRILNIATKQYPHQSQTKPQNIYLKIAHSDVAPKICN